MEPLHLAFLDVGQGDTIVIYDVHAKEAVVVDCVDAISVIDFLNANSIDRLRALVLTHAHADHYVGAIDLIKHCERLGLRWDACVFRWDRNLKKLPDLLEDPDHHSAASGALSTGRKRNVYLDLLEWAKQPEEKKKHLEHHELPKDGHLLRALEFIHPEHRDVQQLFETNNLNNLSIVIRVSNGASALLTGDIEPAGWHFLRQNHPGALANAVLKFPHHGVWRNGDLPGLLNDVKPEFIVISVGTVNKYEHPSAEVFTEVSQRKDIRLLCTQATHQCGKRTNAARSEILKAIYQEDAVLANISARQRSGYPCAGTVVIELSEIAKIIHPSTGLHVASIIERHMKTHKCNLTAAQSSLAKAPVT